MTDIPEIPFGAIENGRVLLQRLADHYDFTCEAGALANCIEYHEAVRCFEVIAQFASESTAALPHLSAPCAVEVKKLEWHNKLQHGEREGFICSTGGILSYSIMLSRFRVYGI